MLLGAGPATKPKRQRTSETGRRFGPYEILSRLGGGGMGVVYRAWDERLHREVALKILHDNYQPPGVRQRFLIEARAASALNHPHICTIFDIGEQDGEPYLVMELIEGLTLKERIACGAPPLDELIRYATEIADALAAAHAKNIVHRDIKPENIFLQRLPDGGHQVKVLDFGLAKIRDEGSGTRMARALDITSVGLTVGTLAYMSPEQARGDALDARSDLFSLGVVMYEMATRRVPFQGPNSAVMLVELLRHEPDPIRSWNESIPRGVEKLVTRLLSKDRASRFQTAVEVREALRRADLKPSAAGWRKRPRQAAVPLVQALDPVARMPHPVGRGTLPGPAAERNPAAAAPASPVLPRDPYAPRSAPAMDPETPTRLAPEAAPADDPQAGSSSFLSLSQTATPQWIRPFRDAAVRESGSRAIAVRPSGEQRSSSELSPGGEAGASQPTAARPPEAPDLAESKATQKQIPPTQQTVIAPVLPVQTSVAVGTKQPSQPELLAAKDPATETPRPVRRSRAVISVLVATVLAVACLLLFQSGMHLRGSAFAEGEPILLTPAGNRTGDPSLDGVAAAATSFQLAQSRALHLLGLDAFVAARAALQREDHAPAEAVSPQRIAEALHVRTYVYGELRRAGQGYLFSLQLLDAKSNDKRASIETTSATREGIPAAIQQAAKELRSSLGEADEQIARSNRPLGSEASRDLRALADFQAAREADLAGNPDEAITAYRHAVVRDRQFAPAAIELAWREADIGDEASAGTHARMALLGAGRASESVHLLAAATDALLRQHDPEQTVDLLRRYESATPDNARGPATVALLRRGQWRSTEALLAAQQALSKDPFDPLASRELALAYLALDRPKDAVAALDQAARSGVVPDPRALLMAHYLAADGPAQWLEHAPDTPPVKPEETATRALLLDNQGELALATTLWKQVAAGETSTSKGTSSLASAALDRALAGQCGSARELSERAEHTDTDPDVGPAPAPEAAFRAGLARALCGDTIAAEATLARLKAGTPQRSSGTDEHTAMLESAIALALHDPARATDILRRTQRRDESPLAAYLRGLAHMASHQWPAAILDLEGVTTRRGASLLTGTNVSPIAMSKLAEAYALQGDTARSSATRRQLDRIWSPDHTASH